MSAAERELLEQAAKAAGYTVLGSHHPNDGLNVDVKGRTYVWRPLTDDGDALRLSFALKINIRHVGSSVQAVARDSDGVIVEVCDIGHVAGGAGLRRVIVMAADAIGRAAP